MTPQEFKEGVGAYALGALDPEEQARYDRFLESAAADADCRLALERAREAVAALGASLPPVKPGSSVWEAIEAEITLAPRKQADDSTDRPGMGIAPAIRTVLPWAIAASLLLLTFLTRQQMSDMDARLDAAEARALSLEAQATALLAQNQRLVQLVDRPGTTLTAMNPIQTESGFRAAFIMHKGVKECMVVLSGMKPQPGMEYTVWFLKGDTPTNAGVIRVSPDGVGVLQLNWDLMDNHPDVIALTIEPDGSTPAPTTKPVLVGPI